MSWAYDQAVQLLNASKLATDGASKLHALQQLGELLFRKEPALAPQFSAALLELQAERAGAVRKFLATVLDALAGSNVQLVAPCAAAAICLVRDSQAAVAKAALLSGTGVLRLTVVLVCKQGAGVPQPELVAAWSASRALFAEACSLAVGAENSGVKLQAIKFVEAAALAYSAALSVPALLSAPLASDLHDSLRVSLEVITRLLGSPLAGPSAVVLIDAAGNVARQRPLLVAELLPPLLRLSERVGAAANNSQAASMAHALKGALVQLLRSGVLASGAWQESVLGALKAMGHQEAAEQAVRQSERSMKRERAQLDRDQDAAVAYEEDAPPAAKRATSDSRGPAGEVADASAPATDPGLLMQVVAALAALAAGGDLATLSSFVTQLSPPVLADVVIYNMRHLSATPPGVHAGMEAAMPGVMALFGAPAPAPLPAAPVMPSAPTQAVSMPPPMAAAPAAAAPPAPLVAQPLGTEVRAAQRLAAATRILRGDEQRIITASGGDAFRCALLGRVGAHAHKRFAEELLDYLLEDYPGRQGHAHLIQWLYCLYADDLAQQQPRKKNGYDEALLAAARAVLRKLSARDRALPSLFVDAPVLPASAMGILEWLVGLGQGGDGEAATTEQCTLGLITLRDVVVHRQAERSACLALVLRCTVHMDDVLRGKAIRMVVNQLHPLPFAAPEIESFASERLDSVPQLQAAHETDAAVAPDDSEETLRRISLYFALCTRADALLPRLFEVYAASGPAAQPAFHRNMAGLARTLGPEAPTLLQLIQSPPKGSEELALQAFQALCDTGASFPSQLVQAGRCAYEATQQDVRFLLPCLPALAKEELRALLPQIVALSSEEVVGAFRRILDVGAGVSPVMSAAEIVVALHHIEASDALPLKKVMDACSACFSPELRDLFTPDSLAVALQQLVELVRLPVLFMRTVIQTATVAPKLHSFILDLLSKLVLKQVWKTDGKLWQGVLRCAKQLVPRSFPVYLQLPAAQLKEALAQSPDLVGPLSAYAATPAVRSTVPGAIRDVLAEVSETAPDAP